MPEGRWRWLKADVELRFEHAFSVGGGATAGLYDSFLLRDGRGRPYVPGSTLKGRLRHNCHRLARAVAPRSVCPPRVPVADPCACVVCRLFGSGGYNPGALYFDDLHATESFRGDTERLVPEQVRVGIGLDRRRRTSAEERLYRAEVAAPMGAIAFRGTIEGPLRGDREETAGQVGLLAMGLALIRTLGGGQSRGLGWVRVQTDFRLDDQPVDAYTLEGWARRWLPSG